MNPKIDIRQIGDLSRDAVFTYDMQRERFVYFNKPFADLLKTSSKHLDEHPSSVFSLVHSEDTTYLRDCFNELLNKGVLLNTEIRLNFEEQPLKHLALDAYLVESRQIVGFVKDLTKMKEHEDYIINYGAKKDTLLDMMSHNLSGPLNLTQNILSWMQRTYKDEAPGEISAQLKLIQDNTQECLDIVDDFLKEEHLESEHIYVKKSRFDLLERIIATVDKLVVTNKNKKFRLLTNLQNLNITTDSVKFFQVIHNLVSNAIKFTPDNGEIDIVVEEKPETFIVSVRDNGIGIPSSLQPALFDKRTVSGRNGLNNESSMGMGLHIVKTLVELLGGRVSFTSEENKGSVFSIELPKS